MPLIESGTYTVNRRKPDNTLPKKLSKFSVWKHWRRSVHEERASPEELNRSEVAGLLTPPESRLVSCGNGSGARRSRPHSLAVQPLNYQRLDPDSVQPPPPPHHQAAKEVAPSQATKIIANKSNNNNTNNCNRNRKNKSDKSAHRKMTSQESIGSCSLDVEKSASERSGSHQHHHDNKEITAGSLSEKTLHSLSLSCNGDRANSNHNNANNNIINGNASDNNRSSNNNNSDTRGQSALSNGHAKNEQQSNGHTQQEQPDDLVDGDQQLTTSKKPSYLGLACSINGYTNITCYDSKLREGFRSRDASPGASRLITRDSRPHENLYSHQSYLTVSGNKSISPLAMDRNQHNGFSNGVRESKYKLETTTTTITNSGTSTTRTQHVEEGYSEVDRGLSNLNHSIDSYNPVCSNSPKKRINSPVASRVHAYNQQNASFSSVTSSSPKLTVKNGSHNASFNDSSILNGSSDGDYGMLNCSSGSEKSFIQQRVERLYGPGALAQGFFFKRSSTGSPRLNTSDVSNNSSNKSNNNNLIEEANDEESLRTLPVLRHLRPEFRAQLPVVSPRKATDGTEQIIKPLKRLSVAENTETKKVSTKGTPEKVAAPADIMQNEKSISVMTNSMQNTDQLPAAPKVVLPAAEIAESSSICVKDDNFEKNVPVKDGHYFMNLLNMERDRLISLAESAEKELDSNTETELPEEAAGKLRSAAGKARLLATQKMKQFEGLCQKNINQEPGEEFPTTNEDLAGFWDMVSLQVVQVHEMFKLLEQSRQAQWKEIVPEIKPVPSTPLNGNTKRRYQTPASKSKSSASASARKARETRDQTRRQLIEEKRRAMRSLNTNSAENICQSSHERHEADSDVEIDCRALGPSIFHYRGSLAYAQRVAGFAQVLSMQPTRPGLETARAQLQTTGGNELLHRFYLEGKLELPAPSYFHFFCL
ncbi:unnamed protein product [Trichogramma brassicae]|uniref:Disks large-associated protein 1 n=1 Tax=Trichogramma brassicae TaxID=86971 RepID=A0A6H5IZR2_9HYME|nr:unnamed protein product [Trichogramma brassicae]